MCRGESLSIIVILSYLGPRNVESPVIPVEALLHLGARALYIVEPREIEKKKGILLIR